jgi:hypothetical protein
MRHARGNEKFSLSRESVPRCAETYRPRISARRQDGSLGHFWSSDYRIRDMVVCHVMRLGAATDTLFGLAFARIQVLLPLRALELLNIGGIREAKGSDNDRPAGANRRAITSMGVKRIRV